MVPSAPDGGWDPATVSDLERFGIASIVREVLGMPGQALDQVTRARLELRFGHDFGRVRVHSDAAAAEAADAVHAKAFTVGNTVVFGAGQYSPMSHEGGRLLAHELTHVAQQTVWPSSDGSRFTSTARGPLIQRSPDKAERTKDRREQRLEDLAKWPRKARRAWRGLNTVDRHLVVLQMATAYGEPFARDFLRLVRTSSRDVVGDYFGRGLGPKPGQLTARGFRLAQHDSVNQWWVHPSGKEITRNYSQDKPGRATAGAETGAVKTTGAHTGIEAEPAGPVIEGTESWPSRLDPNRDRNDIFGSIIAVRQDAEVSFGKGELALYHDGTVELFLEGTTESYVFRPLPGGGCVVYGTDGQRLEGTWMIPEQDIPEPATDSEE
jgi:hypothetical protein